MLTARCSWIWSNSKLVYRVDSAICGEVCSVSCRAEWVSDMHPFMIANAWYSQWMHGTLHVPSLTIHWCTQQRTSAVAPYWSEFPSVRPPGFCVIFSAGFISWKKENVRLNSKLLISWTHCRFHNCRHHGTWGCGPHGWCRNCPGPQSYWKPIDRCCQMQGCAKKASAWSGGSLLLCRGGMCGLSHSKSSLSTS